MRTAIIGAGAAGCFCAIELKRRRPEAVVDVYEAGSKPLAKVAITGGGRCNLTNSFAGINSLKEAYPRGDKLLKKVFSVFDNKDTWKWFENEGVNLVLQDDQCVFPASQDAMQIVNLLKSRMRQLGVNLRVNSKVTSVKTLLDQYDSVVVTTGGYHKPVASVSTYDLFEGLDLEIVPPVPSLFTFNLPSSPYEATLLVNWYGEDGQDHVRMDMQKAAEKNPLRQVLNSHPEHIPARLWAYLVTKSKIREDARWAEIGSKGLNRLCETLTNDSYHIKGQSRFKEEFVTCGGVALSEINNKTLESTKYPGLYFAGEVLDIDGITGGFNLQAAWSTGFLAAISISEK